MFGTINLGGRLSGEQNRFHSMNILQIAPRVLHTTSAFNIQVGPKSCTYLPRDAIYAHAQY